MESRLRRGKLWIWSPSTPKQIMSVSHTTGNLLDFPDGITVIAHGCNMQGKMGSGIAKDIAAKWPEALTVYEDAYNAGELELGTLTVAKVEDGTKRVVNLVTQETVGTDKRRVDYEGLYCALEALRDLLERAHHDGRTYVLGLPAWIGAGLAGGSPEIVEAMVTHLFGKSPVRCAVVTKP